MRSARIDPNFKIVEASGYKELMLIISLYAKFTQKENLRLETYMTSLNCLIDKSLKF